MGNKKKINEKKRHESFKEDDSDLVEALGFCQDAISGERLRENGRALPSNHRQSVSVDGTLTVDNVQKRSDQGSYTCQARNRQGHSDRGTVEVSVMEPPTIYPFSIESSVHLGERVGLQCLVTRGDAPITITWLKDDAQVDALDLPSVTVKNLGEFSSTLLIEQLSTQHNGRYTCRARNAAASAEHSVQLAVNGTRRPGRPGPGPGLGPGPGPGPRRRRSPRLPRLALS
ncbi:Lachesin [Gryllus bimaculatus]|nr:Lachesin [Gryllus bimaculatus]